MAMHLIPRGPDPLYQRIGGAYYWYHYWFQNDAQGMPQKLIATNGLVVWPAVCDSFGNSSFNYYLALI